MLKFIFGPVLGFGAGYSYLVTVIITIVGMMCSVLLFTHLGFFIRDKVIDRLFKNRRIFSKRSRRFVLIWKKYGVKGVAFLTPLLLTPIGGTLILAGYKTEKKQIVFYMLISATFWSFMITGLTYFFGDAFLKFIQ